MNENRELLMSRMLEKYFQTEAYSESVVQLAIPRGNSNWNCSESSSNVKKIITTYYLRDYGFRRQHSICVDDTISTSLIYVWKNGESYQWTATDKRWDKIKRQGGRITQESLLLQCRTISSRLLRRGNNNLSLINSGNTENISGIECQTLTVSSGVREFKLWIDPKELLIRRYECIVQLHEFGSLLGVYKYEKATFKPDFPEGVFECRQV